MASRCGDVDPAAVLYLVEHACGGDLARADKLLNKQSGLIGLTGHQDLKRVLDDAAAGHQEAAVAAEVLVTAQLMLWSASVMDSYFKYQVVFFLPCALVPPQASDACLQLISMSSS